MVASGSAPHVIGEDIRGGFSPVGEPSTPLTAGEVPAQLACQKESARRALETVADPDEVTSTWRGDSTRVWWQPGEYESGGCRSGSTEFGAFVSAVRDDVISGLDPDGTVTCLTDGQQRIDGYREAELDGEIWVESVPGEGAIRSFTPV